MSQQVGAPPPPSNPNYFVDHKRVWSARGSQHQPWVWLNHFVGLCCVVLNFNNKQGEVNELKAILRNPKIMKEQDKRREAIKKGTSQFVCCYRDLRSGCD